MVMLFPTCEIAFPASREYQGNLVVDLSRGGTRLRLHHRSSERLYLPAPLRRMRPHERAVVGANVRGGRWMSEIE